MHHSNRGRARGDRGAVMVEAVWIAPFFFLFLFLIVEFGLLFRNYLSIANAAGDGVRVASSSETPGFADWQVLQQVKRSVVALPAGDIDRIVVYKGNAGDGFESAVPSACKTSSTGIDGVCNVYFADDLDMARADFATYWRAAKWPGLDRDDNLVGGTDYVGVYVEATHQGITGLIGSRRELTASSVMRIEPRQAIDGG